MKKTFFSLVLIALLASCSKDLIQIFDTDTTNTYLDNEGYVFETDTIKITYQFWAQKGQMSFTIFNKLNKPIYIDWKNSAFIVNGNKIDYWMDEELTKSSAIYNSYYVGRPPLPGTGITIATDQGIQNTRTTTIKPEKITFIPPNSSYDRTQFYLYPY